MTPEKVEVVTDSGTSIRPEAKEAKEAKVTIIPLEVKFYENGKFVPYYDLDVSPDEFYRKMLKGEKLPQTSGNVTGKMIETYKKISQKTDSIISIHITSKHSVAWESAVLSARLAQEEIPKEVFRENRHSNKRAQTRQRASQKKGKKRKKIKLPRYSLLPMKNTQEPNSFVMKY